MARERGKCTLKKEFMEINRNNYETYFLLYLDGELKAAEKTEVENFLSMHGDLQKEFSLLQYTIQRPADIIFEPKEILYRKDEKRRVIPIFWIRIAASFLLLLAGGWYLIYQLNDHRQANPVNGQKLVSAGAEKNHRASGVSEKANPIKQERDANTKVLQGMIAQKNAKKDQNADKRTPGRSLYGSSEAKGTGSEDQDIVMQKSNAGTELQTSRNQNTGVVPVKLANAVKTPSLTVAAAAGNQMSDIQKEQTGDLTRDNAISVIALNDQNKGITSFFKKIGKRMPGNETAENTKKLRVSVFQFSY
jgi:hypothetical protein